MLSLHIGTGCGLRWVYRRYIGTRPQRIFFAKRRLSLKNRVPQYLESAARRSNCAYILRVSGPAGRFFAPNPRQSAISVGGMHFHRFVTRQGVGKKTPCKSEAVSTADSGLDANSVQKGEFWMLGFHILMLQITHQITPRTHLTCIFEGQPSKTRPFPIKTRVICVPGTSCYNVS